MSNEQLKELAQNSSSEPCDPAVVKNYIAESKKSYTNISTGAWRAPGSNFAACAEQSFIDEVAEQSGKDPIDFRLELLRKAEIKPIGENNDYDAGRYAGVLKLVREKTQKKLIFQKPISPLGSKLLKSIEKWN